MKKTRQPSRFVFEGPIALVGDTHCGSTSALWPQSWLPGDVPYGSLRYVERCFAQLVDEWPEIDLLILMGDLIEGKAPKSKGTGIFTSYLRKQVEGAVEILAPMAKKARTIVRVAGTPYHDEHDDPLAFLDSELGVVETRQVFNLRIETPGAELGESGVLNVAHHPPGGGVLYEGTKLTRQILWNIIAAARGKIPGARWISRAHLHTSAEMTKFDITAMLNPCWKLADGHAIKGNYEGWQPEIGASLLLKSDIHPSGRQFKTRCFPLPTDSVSSEVLDLADLMKKKRKRAIA